MVKTLQTTKTLLLHSISSVLTVLEFHFVFLFFFIAELRAVFCVGVRHAVHSLVFLSVKR